MAFEYSHFEAISDRYDLSAFRCELTSLNEYLRVSALRDSLADRTQTHVLLGKTEQEPAFVCGYFTLEAGVMPTADAPPSSLPEDLATPPQLPVVYLTNLARDQRFRGERLGPLLLVAAIEEAVAVSRSIGVVGIYLVAATANARRLYEDFGFANFDPEQEEWNRMFLPMSAARLLLSSQLNEN